MLIIPRLERGLLCYKLLYRSTMVKLYQLLNDLIFHVNLWEIIETIMYFAFFSSMLKLFASQAIQNLDIINQIATFLSKSSP